MGSDDTRALHHRSVRPTHYEGQCESCPREKFNRDLEDHEVCFFAPVVRCICVDEGHDH